MQVVDLGQVGRATDAEGLSAFYVHAQRGAKFGDARPLAEAFLKAGDSKVSNEKGLSRWGAYMCSHSPAARIALAVDYTCRHNSMWYSLLPGMGSGLTRVKDSV